GDPKYNASQELPDFPYAQYAESIGLKGIRVDSPKHVGRSWDEALAADRPCVLEVVTDPEVPPLPPHITFDQAKMFMSSVLKGDRGFIGQTAKEMVDTVFPGARGHGGKD